MFKASYNYSLPKKGVVTLSPTAGTWMKYVIVPNLITVAGLAAMYVIGARLEKKEAQELIEQSANTETEQ